MFPTFCVSLCTDPNTSLFIDDFYNFYNDLSEELNYTEVNNTGFAVDKETLACEPVTYAAGVNIAACVFYVLIMLLALPGNLIVGLVIGSKRKVLSPSDVYLFHLMLADILLALCLPFSATAVVWGWVFGDAVCKLVSILKDVSFYSSILFLVCISVDRYQVIVRAMEVHKGAWRRGSCLACVSVWVLGVGFSLPALYNEAYLLTSGEMLCAERYDQELADEWRMATRILRHLLGFLLPLAAMLGCYGVTVARLLRTHGFRRQRAMRVIVAVVVGFLLCWSPYHVALMADTLLRTKVLTDSCHGRTAIDVAMFATQSLGMLHCCINPVLYAFVGQKFRSNLKQMLHRRGVRERASVSRSSRSTSQTSDHTSTVL